VKKQELEFSIDDDGKISIKVIGAQGAECLEMTKAIDFYVQPQKQQTDQQQGQG
jgi:hypothetical protein